MHTCESPKGLSQPEDGGTRTEEVNTLTSSTDLEGDRLHPNTTQLKPITTLYYWKIMWLVTNATITRRRAEN